MFPSFLFYASLCKTFFSFNRKKEQLIYLFYFFMVNHFLLVLFNDQYWLEKKE